jgi:hypothetical protein
MVQKSFMNNAYVAGIFRNQEYPEMPGFSSIAYAFTENVKILGNGTTSVENYF